MYQQPTNLKKRIAVAILVLAFLVGVYWIFNTGFVEVSIPNASGSYSYRITNQKNGKSVTFTSSDSHLKRRLSRGSYTVIVQQDSYNYFSLISNHGFLTTSHIQTALSKEKNRLFVGDNPGSCMAYINTVLVSYACTDTIDNINIHEPATAAQPTYVLKNPSASGENDYVQGITNTKEGSLALIKSLADSNSPDEYSVAKLDSSLRIVQEQAEPNLSTTTDYSITLYKDGFLVYNQSLTGAYYYRSLTASPTVVQLDAQNDHTLLPRYLTAGQGQILSVFTSNIDNKKPKTEVVVSDATGSQNHYSFKANFSSAVLCGTNTLCAVDAKGLHVYGLAGKKASSLFNIRGVATVLNAGNDTLAVTSDGIVNIDIAKRSGSLEYGFGDYKFNNIQLNDTNSYILSLTNPLNKKVALLIDRGSEAVDAIDKQILPLEKLPEISSISVYGHFIYISPNLGDVVYNSSLGIFDYDPATKARVSAVINQTIAKSGINRNVYAVVSTIQ